MLRNVALGVIAASLCAGPVRAIAYYGAGAGTCISLTNDREMANSGANPYLIPGDTSWLLGFISALSLQNGVEGFGGASPDVVVSEVEAVCSIHPDWPIASAAAETFDRLGRPQNPMHLEH